VRNAARIYATEAEVTSRLYPLRVSTDALRQALEHGYQYASSTTLHDPNGAEGSMMYHKINRGLRDVLVPQGWKVDRTKNYETTVHESENHAIAVAAGNANTGIKDKRVSTKRERGPATRDAVETNYTLDMFEADPGAFPSLLRPLPSARLHTWLLLHYIDHKEQEIRSELSLPLEMNSEGHVSEWQERIILSAIPFNREPMSLDDTDEADVEVTVTKKAN
jgi:hypothetical protein